MRQYFYTNNSKPNTPKSQTSIFLCALAVLIFPLWQKKTLYPAKGWNSFDHYCLDIRICLGFRVSILGFNALNIIFHPVILSKNYLLSFPCASARFNG